MPEEWRRRGRDARSSSPRGLPALSAGASEPEPPLGAAPASRAAAARKAAEERFEACRKEQIALEAGAKQMEAQLAGGEEIDEEAQRQQGNALAAERLTLLERQRTLHSRANTNKTALASVRNKSDELERLEREYSWLSMLSQTANGTLSGKDKITLETYIQMTFFDRILKPCQPASHGYVRRAVRIKAPPGGRPMSPLTERAGSERDRPLQRQ